MKCITAAVVLSLAVALAAVPAMAQQQENQKPIANPLVQLLQSKGILTAEEASSVNQAGSPEEANARLAQLLVSKGVISDQEYKHTFAEPVAAAPTPPPVHLLEAVYHAPAVAATASQSNPAPEPKPEVPVIPAVTPLRVLPIDVPKQGGIIPDIKLGSGANLKIYGFLKATAVSDTASSGGATFGSNDFPLPLLLGGDTGPTPIRSFTSRHEVLASEVSSSGYPRTPRLPSQARSRAISKRTTPMSTTAISAALAPVSSVSVWPTPVSMPS